MELTHSHMMIQLLKKEEQHFPLYSSVFLILCYNHVRRGTCLNEDGLH